jgi:hypothetical protein
MLAANKLIVLFNRNQGQSKLLQLKKKMKIAKVSKMVYPQECRK